MQLRQQVCPLELELALRYGEPDVVVHTSDALTIEPVASTFCLPGNPVQVAADGRGRIGKRREPEKLGMVAISFGSSRQYGLRQQGFPPGRQ